MPWDPTAPGSTAQTDNQGETSRTTTGVVASAARTATGQGTAQRVRPAVTLGLLVDVTAASGTTPSLTVSVEWSHDGTTWFTPETADAFAALTAAGKKVKTFAVKAPFYRVVWTITGTTPSFTFAVHAHYID